MNTIISIAFLVCIGGAWCNDTAFINIGTHYGVEANGFVYRKTFFVARHFRSSWQEALTLCKAYGMEFATFDTPSEYSDVTRMLRDMESTVSSYLHVGAITRVAKSKTEWYWVNNDQKIGYEMKWLPGDPNFSSDNQWCLAVGTKTTGPGAFGDIDCHSQFITESFMCHKRT